MRVIIVILITVSYSLAEEVLKVSSRDSYLDAYHDSKTSSKLSKAEKKSDVYPVYPGPVEKFGPSDSFGGPSYSYGPPSSQYGPHTPEYGPPQSQYGPPSPLYGPPSPQYGPPPSYGTFAEPVPQYGPPAYGPPSAQNLQVFYGVPHAMISIWDKLWEKIKWKLDLFTFGKILLKLVIFKKIISLIAIICLLLFIPSLKHKKGFFGDEDGNERGFQMNSNVDDKLNNLSAFVAGAIDDYMSNDKKYPASCDTVYCRTQKMLKHIEKKTLYKKLVKLYTSGNNLNKQ